MIDAILRFALKNRLLVVVASILLLIYGGIVIQRMPVDVFPDLNRPTVTVMTEALGLAPEEVETLVTLPIETVLNGAPGVQRLRSTSGVGLSVVTIEFDWGTDIYRDRQLVSEKLQLAASRLPAGMTPTMGPISSIMGEIMLIGMTGGETTSPMEVRTLADWVVRRRLLTIPGVAQVIPIGGGVKQVQVKVWPDKLRQFNVSLPQLEQAVGASNRNTTGGFVERQSQEYLIRNIGRTGSPEAIGETVVAYRGGVPVRVKQVADVGYGIQVKRGDASVMARPAVIISVQKQPGTDTVALTKEVEKALDELKVAMPADVTLHPHLFRQATFIEAAVRNVEEALRDGAILVTVVLILFLMNLRTTVITLTAIPLSLVLTAFFLHWQGISINTMTLGGLAVAIGELVDDAIVDVENIFRRLKENRLSEQPRSALRVVYEASREIRNSIVFATIVVVLVFIPLFAMGGIEGRLFTPLGIAYITAILSSLLVSLTLTPVLCYYLLPRAKAIGHEADSRLVQRLKAWDARAVRYLLPRQKQVLTVAVVLVALAAATVPFMGRSFLPAFNEGTATINLLSVPGTSLSESNKVGTLAERLLMQVPEVASVGRRTGRAELDEHAEGVHYTEIDVDLKADGRSRDLVLADIRSQLAKLPGVVTNIGQPISHRLDHLLSGVRAQVAIKLFGNDLDTLRAKAAEIEAALRPVPGVVDLQIEKQVLIPQIAVRVDRDKAAQYGVQPGAAAEWLETALNGKVVSQILDGQRTIDLVVRLAEPSRDTIEALRQILIDTPAGTKLPLAAIADVHEDLGPNQIMRENVQRRIVISSNVAGRDLGSVITEIQAAVRDKVSLPTGYFVTYGGQFESQQAATRQIAVLSLLSLAGMFLALYVLLRSTRLVLMVMLNIPLALIGSVLAIALTGGVLSVASLVGFVTLTGIAARNGIMMISHYLHLLREEGEAFDEHMIVRGANERLVPVLMTSATALFALIPLAISAGAPGKEILQPVAVVILGGLISSTLLDTLLTPVVFWHFGRPAIKQLMTADQGADLAPLAARPDRKEETLHA
jgi:CzcA family heavy metal efflux pump